MNNPAAAAPATTNLPIVQAIGLKRAYPQGREMRTVLTGVDLSVKAGETVAILGRSGSGKSTLLHLLGLLDRPGEGVVRVLGEDTAGWSGSRLAGARNTTIGFVFQLFHLMPEFNVLENIVMPSRYRAPMASAPAAAIERARWLIGKLGLDGQIAQRPHTLSGGERQRTAIARALINKPRLLLCDEPTGNLDRAQGEAIMQLIFDLAVEEQFALVVVTHDEELARRCGRTLVMREGHLSEFKDKRG
ncbi:MAG TPA: ABC transporter ATP-binding protein [Planctomycetota bacterium]|jgi:lipoprotein-releasing system ATP-binding protein|nr:ABC transporter ATP-binding protein [Planctomycetota bacterium]